MAFSKLDYLRDLRGAKISASEFRVLVMVLTYTNQHGEQAFPGIARLAEDCGISPSTVKRNLQQLCTEGGWLRQHSRGHRRGDNVALASEYSLAAPISMGHPCADENASTSHGWPVEDGSMGQMQGLNGSNAPPQEVTGDPPLGPEDGPGGGPRPRCARHSENSDEKCRACGRRREWDEQQAHDLDAAGQAARDAIRAAIEDCNDCDVYGRLNNLSDCPKHPNFRTARAS